MSSALLRTGHSSRASAIPRLPRARPLLTFDRARARARALSSLISCETIYDPTPSFLSAHFASASAANADAGEGAGCSGSAALFLISAPTPHPSLPGILRAIQTAYPESVGAFSACAPAPSQRQGHAHAHAQGQGQGQGRGQAGGIAVSVARFRGARTWYDPQKGREAVSVGRYRRPVDGDASGEDRKGERVGELALPGMEVDVGEGKGSQGVWDQVWEPERGVERISDLEHVETDTILLFSSSSPRPTFRSLDTMFPLARKVGLVSAPTPFLTGRPHTLFHRERIYAHGAVGLALAPESEPSGGAAGASADRLAREEIRQGVEPLGEAMVVDGAQGNMLLSLIGAPNPTQHLIQAIQARSRARSSSTAATAPEAGTTISAHRPGAALIPGLGKDESFYLALLDPSQTAIPSRGHGHGRDRDPGAPEIVRLLSGDPSRGALSLEMEDSLRAGQRVQRRTDVVSSTPSPSENALTFATIPRLDEELAEADFDAAEHAHDSLAPREPRVVPGFLGLSEDGFIHTSSAGRTVVYSAAGGYLRLTGR